MPINTIINKLNIIKQFNQISIYGHILFKNYINDHKMNQKWLQVGKNYNMK